MNCIQIFGAVSGLNVSKRKKNETERKFSAFFIRVGYVRLRKSQWVVSEPTRAI